MFRSPTVRALVVVTIWAVTWAKAMGLTRFVDPFFLDWMFDGDWQAQVFGWLFTQKGPWGLPLGQAPDLVAPAGTSAAFTDAIPVMAVLGKFVALFVAAPFQYFGAWMVFGFIAMGWSGVWLARRFTDDAVTLTLVGALAVTNPILTTRYGHPTFLAAWLLFALIALQFEAVRERPRARRLATATLALLFVACGAHAYLAVMAAGLALASLARLVLIERSFSKLEGLLWLVSAPAVTVGSLWLFGFLSGASTTNLASEGFGEFSADLLTFFNPTTWSRLLPPLAMGGRQYEGFAYLGVGVLFLLVAAVALLVRRRPSRAAWVRLVPVLVIALGAAVFALSNRVTIAGKPVLELSAVYARLAPLPQIFRSSGRFMWPLHFLVLAVSLVAVARHPSRALRNALLGAAWLLQVVDFDVTRSPLPAQRGHFTPFRDPAWALLKDYRHLVVDPIQLQWLCPYNPELIPRLSWEAWRFGVSINSGHVGRPPAGFDCRRHVAPAELRDDTVYVPYFPEYQADFATFECGPLEGVTLCVSPTRPTALLQELQRRRAAR